MKWEWEVWRSESLCEKRGRENPWSVRCLALWNYKHRLPIHLLSSNNVLSWSHLAEGFRCLVLSKCSVAALGCRALFFNMMTCSTGRFPQEKFCSAGSTKCILADLCFNSCPPSVLFWFLLFHEGKHPAGLHKGLSLSVMSFRLCSSLAQMWSWTQSYRGHCQSVWEGGSCFQRFPRTDAG